MSGKPYGMLLAGAIAGLSAGFAQAQEFGARLNGFEELGALNAQTGAILSGGKGKHSLDVDPTQITYRLTYSGLSAPVTQAHIHFGKIHVAGGDAHLSGEWRDRDGHMDRRQRRWPGITECATR